MSETSRLLRFFPVPSFLEMPAVGFDVSDESIHFTELVEKDSYQVLGRYGEERLPAGLISGGVIENPEGLKNILKIVQKKTGFKFIRVSLPEQKGYLVKMRVPQIKKSEIRSSLQLQLEDYVPLSPNKAIFDYQTVSCDDTSLPKPYDDMGVAVMPRDVVRSYVEVFKGTGLTPLSFELEAHAVARAVMPEGSCDTVMIVDIGATRTGFSIVHKGIVRFTSTVAIGGDFLTEAVMKAFDLDKKAARKKKEEEGLMQRREDTRMYSVLMPIVSILYDEIQKRLIYWNGQKEVQDNIETMKIQKILLCGGEANVPGLKHYLISVSKNQVELANPWVNIAPFDKYIPELPYNHSLRYVTALGLSLYPRH